MATETMEIRQLARDFAESDLRPHVEAWDHDAAIPDGALAQIAELGFFGMLASEADGGMAFDMPTYVAALEELAWGEAGAAVLVATANRAGKQATELALVDNQDGVFLVPSEKSGGERVTTLGLRTVPIVRAPSNVAAEASNVGRIGIAAISIGIAQAAVDHARGYADSREQFGTKLKDFEGLQHKLADMSIRTAAARALLVDVAAEPCEIGTATVKVFASETAMWVTTQAVQIFGGYGYMRDYPVEKLMRDAKAMEMLEGANDMLRVLIARELYR